MVGSRSPVILGSIRAILGSMRAPTQRKAEFLLESCMSPKNLSYLAREEVGGSADGANK